MILLSNKTASRDFEFLKTLYAGIVLSGPEVKSLRLKHGSLSGSHVKVINGEAFLMNAQINPYSFARQDEYDPTRTRKLLLKKSEIASLQEASAKKGISIVPVSIETAGRNLKLKLAIGRGKKEFEKREDLKKRTLKRELAKEFKSRQIKV